jgi:glyceraldehyde-3-phosphate dehydrogenase (NAD(P))
MHAVRFNIKLKQPIENSIDEMIKSNPLISKTNKFDSNIVFELGRRYGLNGRLYSHAIVLTGNILASDKTIKGWAFVPQEGNSIISTIHAYLLQTNHPQEAEVIAKLISDLCREEW